MVWSMTCPKDGKVRFIRGSKRKPHISRNSVRALDEVPEGWEIKIVDGNIKIEPN